ncbi:hypothetical protein [Ruthenibacterium lactatiformans]|uniref:hypothetical protein n=1 Tax=Ruthenibacterium lactatiformans TaxID=1550024 RepID=UPI001FC7E3B2|nr:hypothetical protein [Ruthenibacterium lactatiformans]
MFDPADPPKFTEEQIIHIVVRVWDIAGNVGEEKARDIVLDKTPPTASHTLTPGKDGKDTLDENYAALWAALEAELSALSAQGADSAGCSYADGAITVWA